MSYKKIPEETMTAIKARDKACVYCGRPFSDTLKSEWEHIINDGNNCRLENMALCCGSCNRSKGNRKLSEWLNAETPYRSQYVKDDTLADIIKEYIKNNPEH